MCLALALGAFALVSVAGCPQPAPNAQQASGSNINPGTYTGDADHESKFYCDGELLDQAAYSVPLSVTINENGQWLSDVDGTPIQAGYSGQFVVGDITVTKTATSVVSVSDSIIVRGTIICVAHQQPDNPITGVSTITCKKLTDSSIEYTESWFGASSADYTPVCTMRMGWEGTLRL